MKKHFNFKSVYRTALVALCLLTVGVGNVWGYAYLKGSWDSWTNHDISGGSCEITLDANTEYEFGIDVDGSFYSYTNQNFTTTSTSFQIYTNNGNCKITTGEAGTYIFKTWYDNGRYMAVYYPQARLTKQKYIYFDARNQTNWNSANFDARFWFKYYDSGGDNGSVDCNKGSALENWVYYALVPDHDYIGQIQMNRLNPSNHDDVWCTANIAYAKDRTASAQNCLKEESGKADYCIYWTPQWTTYCPPMSSVTLADNGTTNWGGNGSSSTPYLVPTGGDIKVHVTASASALNDANMTKYFLFKKEGSGVGEGSSSTEKTITASGTTGTKEAVTVDAYNYYNSTEGTHLTSSALYYEARTPYTISYAKGSPSASIDGSRDSETKLKGVNFTLPNSAVFTRTGFTQTGWATSDGGSKAYDLGASYTTDAAQTFYPYWTENEYNITINVAGSGTTSPASSTIGKIETPSGDITATPGTGYSFSQWGFSKQGESDYDVWCAAGYTSTNATIRILAKRDGTLTANFTANNYTVGLDNREADPEHGGTASVNVTYDATTGLTSAITPPQKEHYTFGGYYISTDRGATLTNIQLIDASGNWNTGVSGYIDGSKRWICAGDTMLYAKWTENLYSVTVTAGANGSVSPSSVSNIGYVTASGDITATANTGYHFVNWTLPANVPTAYGYIATSNPIRIRATASGQTITANFAANDYTVTLDNREPTTPGTTSVSVTYNATTNLTSAIIPPQKTHYTFGGYFTGVGGAGTQLINTDGSWIKDVTGYTSHDGDNPKWVLADDLTLYAKWTETLYTVNVAVSPAGMGTVKVNGSTVTQVTAGFATHSPLMIADSANAAWCFKEWQVSSADVQLQTESHSIYKPQMDITATAANQTVTAVFQRRYTLVGAIYDDSGTGGMPGMTNYDAEFTINSTSPYDLTRTQTLLANTKYKVEVHDRAAGQNLGRSGCESGCVLEEGSSLLLENKDNVVFLNTVGAGEYIFKITAIDGSGHPTLTVLRPHQMHMGHKRVDIDGNDHSDNTGGALTATTGGNSISDGGWYNYNADIAFTASTQSGYSLTWYTDNTYTTPFNPQPGASWTDYAVTHDENVYAKFTELSKSVTINKTGEGSITVGGNSFDWGSSTICGVTTTRRLVATAATGYTFNGWTLSSNPYFQLDDKASENDNDVTLRGKTSGSTGTLTANFTAKTYTVTLHNDHDGSASDDGTATATYDATSLTVSKHAAFSGWNLLGYWNNVGTQVTDASGNVLANVPSYSDASNRWKYDGNADLWAHWSRSVTLDREGGTTGATSLTVTYKGTTLGSYTAPTRTGYTFAGYWTAAGGTGTLVINTGGTLEADVSGYTDASHQWIKQDATTLYAKWTADTYTVTLHNDHDGSASDDGTATATYDATSLTVSKHAAFDGWTLLGYWNSSAVQVTDANGTLNANVDGFTDAGGHWTKTSNADLWAHWSRTITLDKNGGKTNGSVTVTYKDKATTPIAPVYSGYTLEGYYAEAGCTTKVMNTDGSLVANVSGYTDGSSNWTNKTAAVLYAKWTSPNFVIYRTGDKAGDPHALSDAVESFAGGTISKPIEFRMKVSRLDKWYTLCLPFTVTAVKVWDEEDGQYYDIVPYYRSGGTFYTGHYIIRTPVSTTDFAIENFDSRDRWVDPSKADFLPSANRPYIIQWHDGYFSGKYISFFGPTGQTIPTSMNQGANTSSDETVNIYGNNCMTSGTVRDAYMLDPDYGSGGAWLREEVGTDRTVLPFECFIRANATTTAKYRVLQRDMDDTPTGWDTVSETENKATKVLIDNNIYIIREGRIYTIQGTLVKDGK